MSPSIRTTIKTPGIFTPAGEYSCALSAGGFLFIAGLSSLSVEGTLVGEGDVATQTRQIFKNIGLILQSAGACFEDVIEFTTYLVGIESVQPFMETRKELFPSLYPRGDYPTNTLINVQSLAGSKALVEIKTVASLHR